MNKSESIKNLAQALITFHVKVDKIKKDAKNPFFKSTYASLSNILEAIDEPLIECNLTVVQFPNSNGLTSVLIHSESGEYMEESYQIHPVPDYLKEKDSEGKIIWRGESYVSPQSIGSAITYARRYALTAILGLNIDEDDDANKATHGNSFQHTKGTADTNGAAKNDLPWLNKDTKEFKGAIAKLAAGLTTIEKIKAAFKLSTVIEKELRAVKQVGMPQN